MKKPLYTVELWDDESNGFIIHSRHRNETNAIVNCEVVSKSRKRHARVIYKGNIVFDYNNPILNQLKDIVKGKEHNVRNYLV